MQSASRQRLEVRSLPTGQRTVIVALAGELDLASSPGLESELKQLSEAGARQIVIDATDLTFIDSSGMSVLVVAHRMLMERDGGLEVYNARPAIRRTLDASLRTAAAGDATGCAPR